MKCRVIISEFQTCNICKSNMKHYEFKIKYLQFWIHYVTRTFVSKSDNSFLGWVQLN